MPVYLIAGETVFAARHRSSRADTVPLVLLHGAGGSHLHWGAAVRTLPEADVCALDLPGHGRSPGRGRANVAEYASLVVRFLDALGLDRAILAGHSMGGAIAQGAALDFPARIAGLVLVGTGSRLRVLPKILEGTLTDYAATVQLICQSAYSENAPAELTRRGQQQMMRVAAQVVHDDFAACNAFDATDRLGEIRCPALVLCGTEDRLTPPKYSTLLAERIPAAQLVLIEGAGHMVMIEKERQVAEAMSAWLTQLWPRTGFSARQWLGNKNVEEQ